MKKKKQIRTVVITLVFLLLLVGGYVAMNVFLPDESETAEEKEDEDEVIFTLEEDTVDHIVYTNKNGTIELKKKGEEWSTPTDQACPVNSYTVQSMVASLKEVKSSRTIEGNQIDKKEFGLDKPSLIVEFSQKDGQKTTFTLGALNTVVSKYYFQKSGDEKVYLIDTTMYNSFDYDLLKLAKVEEYPSLGQQDIYEFILKKDGKTLYFKDSKDAAHKKNDSEIPECVWQYGENQTKLKAYDPDRTEDMITALIGLTNAECVTYKVTQKDLEKYGLLNPAMEINVKYTEMEATEEEKESEEVSDTDDGKETAPAKIIDREHTLYIGGKDSDSGEYYVQPEGSKSIYTMNISGIDTIMSAFEKEK